MRNFMHGLFAGPAQAWALAACAALAAACGDSTPPAQSVNRPPAITVPAVEQVAEGQALQIAVQAADPDEDLLRLSAAPMPPNATFETQSGVFNWTPAFDAARADPYVVTFTADDGRNSTQATTAISVIDVNRSPELHLPPATSIAAGQPLSVNVNATDPDAEDVVTITVIDPPDGASFDGHTFGWTPDFQQRGVHLVSFEANDNHQLSPPLSVTDGMLILVTEICLSNNACSGGQVCGSGVCERCTDSIQCDPGLACIAGACGPCTGNEQCAGGEACIDRRCGGCADNSDCEPGLACVGGVCRSCEQPSQCREGQACASGTCGTCSIQIQCRTGEACVAGDCGPCDAQSECSAGQACVSGACGPCAGAGQCTAGQGCVSGSCGQCENRTQCRAGEACLPSGTCGPCNSPTQCGGLACVDGVCGPCESASDCAAGKGCVSGACGQCGDRSECRTGQACDLGTCGQCTAASQCGAGQGCVGGTCGVCANSTQCRAGEACVEKTCGSCSSGSECVAGLGCVSGTCASCTEASQCPATKGCVGGTCTTCTDRGQCRPGEVCPSGTCEPCASAAQCAAGQGCVSGSCDACTDRSHCRTGEVCVSGSCEDCTSATQCAAGEGCVAGSCASCTDRIQCRAGEACNLGTCGQCDSNDDCASDQACVTGVCGRCTLPAQCPAGLGCVSGACGACEDRSQCRSGQACIGGTCAACTSPTQCDPGQGCASGTCGPCANATQCPAGQGCVSTVCTTCSSAGQCRSGEVCASGVCAECATNANCTGGEVCISGVCSPCTSTAQCSGGQVCTSGACTSCTADAQCTPGNACYTGACAAVAASCRALHDGNTSLPDGPYLIRASDGQSLTEYCDMTGDGGGWTRCFSWEADKTGASTGSYFYRPLDYSAGPGGRKAGIATPADMLQSCNRDAATQEYRFTTYVDGALQAAVRFPTRERNAFGYSALQQFSPVSSRAGLPVTVAGVLYNGRPAVSIYGNPVDPWGFHIYRDENLNSLYLIGDSSTSGGYYRKLDAYDVVRINNGAWWSNPSGPTVSSLAMTLWFRDTCASPPCGCATSADCVAGELCLSGKCAHCTSDGQCGAGKVCREGACDTAPGNCQELEMRYPRLPDGAYVINHPARGTMTVYCDLTGDGGGWTRCVSIEADKTGTGTTTTPTTCAYFRRWLDYSKGRQAGPVSFNQLWSDCRGRWDSSEFRLVTKLDDVLSSSTVVVPGSASPFSGGNQTWGATSNSGPVSLPALNFYGGSGPYPYNICIESKCIVSSDQSIWMATWDSNYRDLLVSSRVRISWPNDGTGNGQWQDSANAPALSSRLVFTFWYR